MLIAEPQCRPDLLFISPPIHEESLEFWSNERRARGDSLNRDIWKNSPMAMAVLHGIRSDGIEFSGEFGCQQAMVGDEAFTYDGQRLAGAYDDDEPLPWIPDWIGKEFQGQSGVTVIGPSYPPVVSERSPNWPGLSLEEYRSAGSADAFLNVFTEQVLPDEEFGHFSQIESLLFPFRTADDLGYFNLCRGSFVTQCQIPGDGYDMFGDDRLDGSHYEDIESRREYHLLYDEYVRANEEWTWQRLTQSKSRAIIALGKVAEHGLLRLFQERGASITFSEDGTAWNPPALENEIDWPSVPADPVRPINSWIAKPGRWWNIRDQEGSNWRLLPVFSLQEVEKEDTGFRRTRRILPAFFGRKGGQPSWSPYV